MKKSNLISFADYIQKSLDENMSKHKNLVLFGEGIDREPLINIKGINNKQSAAETMIMDAYVGVGTTQFTIKQTEGFSVGDEVTIRRPSTLAWIKLLGADHFGGGVTATGWKPGERDIFF